MRKIFITGTNTDVGKTYCSCRLIEYANHQGFKTAALKPIASGCEIVDHKLINSDAVLLQHATNTNYNLETINPIRFKKPIAPHIAANQTHIGLTVNRLNHTLQPFFSGKQDILFIEGVGGWLVPLNNQETMAEWVTENQFEVILVVGITLGCLNHALLTEKAIHESGLKVTGWIANIISPETLEIEENISTLEEMLTSPLLHKIKYNQSQINAAVPLL